MSKRPTLRDLDHAWSKGYLYACAEFLEFLSERVAVQSGEEDDE